MTRFLALAAAVAIMIVGLAWFFSPPDYEVFALVRVAEKPGQVLDKTSEGSDAFAIFKRTQVQLIKSGPVLRGAVREPKIANLSIIGQHADDPVAWLRDELILDYPDDAEILRVAIKGRDPDELIAIVNAVVEKYLSDVVEAARMKRLEHESKLEKRYQEIAIEFQRQARALNELEQLHKTSGTDAAAIKKRVAEDGLVEALVARNTIQRQIFETDLDIEKTAQPIADGKRASTDGLTLPILKEQKKILEVKLSRAKAQIEDQARQFDKLQSFAAAITAKKQELSSLEQIMTRLKAEIDRTQVERLSQERITKLDDAVAVAPRSDRMRKYAGLSAATIVSLGLVAIGLAAGRRRRSGWSAN